MSDIPKEIVKKIICISAIIGVIAVLWCGVLWASEFAETRKNYEKTIEKSVVCEELGDGWYIFYYNKYPAGLKDPVKDLLKYLFSYAEKHKYKVEKISISFPGWHPVVIVKFKGGEENG